MRELITTGANVEQAVAEACERLGMSRDDVSVEVLEMPQKKLFGMSPAKVKVTAPDAPEGSIPEPDGLEVIEYGELIGSGNKPPRAEPPRKNHDRPKRENDRAEREKREPREDFTPSAEEHESPVELAGGALMAFEYLQTLSDKLGAKQISFEAVTTENGLKFKADGEDAALLIGRRGETMEALQYLCSLVYHRGEREHGRLIVDVANYRQKRERSLQQLAKNTAMKVLRTKRQQTLEPMNPYERRIVHSAIQLINGVKSESVGEEPRRRVVVMTEAGGKPRYNGGNRQRRNDRGEQPKRQPEPSAEQSAAPKAVDSGELPLYSKIEL